jgi:haloacetate dehalogenase
MNGAHDLFPGFAYRRIDTGEGELHVCLGGSGPPLLLLHGYPQTHVAWHKVAGRLAERFTVVAPDLRGYGRSGCPPDDLDHKAYAKRTMAEDLAHVMRGLCFSRYLVMGHDRGARVAYRLALDKPECVARLVVLDIMTTWDEWQPEQRTTRHRIDHWAFLAQPAPIPETLIGKDPVGWLEGRLKRGTRSRTLDAFDPRALAAYGAGLSDRDRIHATCEDFRASASCDLTDDEADRRLGRRIMCPTLVLWGSSGSLAEVADPVALWRPWCVTVSGRAIDSGHFIPEENPEALLDAVLPFLDSVEAIT